MLQMFLLKWIKDSSWSQKVWQFNTLLSNSLIKNFGNLHMTSPSLLSHAEELFEIKEKLLFTFLFEASSIDTINPNIQSTNVLLSSISASFVLTKQNFHHKELYFFSSFYRLNYHSNLLTFLDVVSYWCKFWLFFF